uniref:DUF4218 domain-containing protein n=1 Tax=Chenopodium quinoa TaxID=63459 RepID=A0A803MT56_CHEQI
MQCYLLVYGTDSSYNPWVSYGENDKQDGNIENDENTMEVSNDEEDEMPFDDMAPLVFDATNAWNNNTTTSEVPIDSGNTMEFGSSSCNDETPNKDSYNPWVSYGENDKQDGNIENDENTMEVSNDEEDEMPFDDMAPLVFDATNAWNNNTTTSEVPIDSGNTMEFGSSSCNDETPNKEFMTTLLKDIEVELYPGCKTFKRLEFLVTLPHIKVSNKWSDKSFSMLLSALHRAFNHDKKFPANSYESKKYTKALGLDYIKIDACVNHCILFRKEFANEEKCPKCLAPRWKDKVVQDHKWRRNRSAFGGKVERGPPPTPLTGHDVLEKLSGYSNVEFGKGKNKDSLNARLDLDSMKMHSQLRATYLGDKKWKIPPASYNLTLNERRKIVTFLSKLAFPDAYASNISRCTSLQDGKIMGMKTHDYHVFMQDLLTPAFKGVIDEKVLEPFRELSLFFKQLCSKTLKVSDLKQMESNIAVTLFKLERIFVPAFFGVMIHHPMHLATEARMAGPVHCR